MLFILMILSVLNFFQAIIITQAEVIVVFTDIDVTLNPEYFAPDYEVFLLDEGIDNQVFVNYTVIKLLPEASTVYFNILGATMGEYKINTGFKYSCTLCEVSDEPILFGRMMSKMGMEVCPGKLGNYGNKALEIDLSTFPDEFAPNKYALDVWLDTDQNDRISSFRVYFTVQ